MVLELGVGEVGERTLGGGEGEGDGDWRGVWDGGEDSVRTLDVISFLLFACL